MFIYGIRDKSTGRLDTKIPDLFRDFWKTERIVKYILKLYKKYYDEHNTIKSDNLEIVKFEINDIGIIEVKYND